MDVVYLLEKYWWLIIIFLIGVFVNHLVELTKIDHKKFLKSRDDKQIIEKKEQSKE